MVLEGVLIIIFTRKIVETQNNNLSFKIMVSVGTMIFLLAIDNTVRSVYTVYKQL